VRTPWPALVGGVAVVLIGGAGLVRGAVPQHPASGSSGSGADPIMVSGAYVRAPVPPTQIAAAYFTVHNTTGTPDRLTGISTGAGATAVLHSVDASGAMNAVTSALIPAHGTLVLSTGKAHVMIEHLFGTVAAGQHVNIELDFQRAGPIDVIAPVIAVGAPVPPAIPSGAHS
jgi:periplasmic copper chaperone A